MGKSTPRAALLTVLLALGLMAAPMASAAETGPYPFHGPRGNADWCFHGETYFFSGSNAIVRSRTGVSSCRGGTAANRPAEQLAVRSFMRDANGICASSSWRQNSTIDHTVIAVTPSCGQASTARTEGQYAAYLSSDNAWMYGRLQSPTVG